jgi:ABC-type spermidine/putrescine transport system permease subunit II
MKKQPSMFERGYISVVSFLVALPICAVIWVSMKIVWPILRFCAKFAWKQLRKSLSKPTVAKPLKETLRTPAIFKDAPNLARARSIRF